MVVALLTPDEHSSAASACLSRADEPLAVSDFATAEFFSAVALRARRRDLTDAQRDAAADRYVGFSRDEATCFTLQPADGPLAAAFVRRFELNLRAPDALHLAICQRIGATLLTFDEAQASAAAVLGIPLAAPAGAP